MKIQLINQGKSLKRLKSFNGENFIELLKFTEKGNLAGKYGRDFTSFLERFFGKRRTRSIKDASKLHTISIQPTRLLNTILVQAGKASILLLQQQYPQVNVSSILLFSFNEENNKLQEAQRYWSREYYGSSLLTCATRKIT